MDIPLGAEVSEDGLYWWDGSRWQPTNSPADVRGDSDTQLVEEIRRVADTGELPGDSDLITELLREYFMPDANGVPDDASGAEVSASLDDTAFTGAEAG